MLIQLSFSYSRRLRPRLSLFLVFVQRKDSMREPSKSFLVLRRCGEILSALVRHLPRIRSGPYYWREVIEDVGGGIIKLAQILAMRYDLLPSRYCREFANLFDRVSPLSKEEIRQVFQKELGKAPEEIFETFSYDPYATASFGQVHRASLGGVEVAVKVQKPNLRPRVYADLALVKFLVRLAEWFLPSVPINLRDAISEWESWTWEELDYSQEARHAKRFRESNASPYVYIPEVFFEQSTPRILVTEFLDGPNLNEIHKQPLLASQGRRELIARHMIWSNLLHYFKGGFFHADPHLGNLILLRDGRLGVIDFGIMGEAGNPRQNYHFANFMRLASAGLAKEAADHFRKFMKDASPKLSSALKHRWRKKSPERIEKGIQKFLENKFSAIINDWAENVGKSDKDLASRSTARYFLTIVSCARRFGLEIPVNLLAFIRATIIADMVCLVLNPAFDMKEEIRLFFSHYPEICQTLEKEARSNTVVPVPKMDTRSDAYFLEKQFEENDRILERYTEYAARAIERILEEGSRGLAYFSTTKA